MITVASPGPTVSAAANLSDYRSRSTVSQRTVLPDSAPQVARNVAPSGDPRLPQQERTSEPAPPKKDSSSMFAAAVISGALSPTPQTMGQLMVRIGTSAIPEEFEARLRDLIA